MRYKRKRWTTFEVPQQSSSILTVLSRIFPKSRDLDGFHWLIPIPSSLPRRPLVRHAILPNELEAGTRDEPLKTSAWEATSQADVSKVPDRAGYRSTILRLCTRLQLWVGIMSHSTMGFVRGRYGFFYSPKQSHTAFRHKIDPFSLLTPRWSLLCHLWRVMLTCSKRSVYRDERKEKRAIPHLFERLFLISWEDSRDFHMTMPLSLKTMEVQIKGDQ